MKTAKISIFELKWTWQISVSPIWWTPKKNNPGGPKSRKLLRRRWYANENNPSRCLVAIFKLYNQLCLPKHNPSAFHLQPLQKTTSDCRFSSWTIWFKNVLRGWNTWSQNQPLTKSYYSHVPSLPHKFQQVVWFLWAAIWKDLVELLQWCLFALVAIILLNMLVLLCVKHSCNTIDNLITIYAQQWDRNAWHHLLCYTYTTV